MAKTYSRAKRKFKSARAAWADIAKKTGLRPSQVKRDDKAGVYRWIRK